MARLARYQYIAGRGKPHKSAIGAKHSVIVLDDFSN